MSLSIIVMGASGRMGTTIANLAKEQGMEVVTQTNAVKSPTDSPATVVMVR